MAKFSGAGDSVWAVANAGGGTLERGPLKMPMTEDDSDIVVVGTQGGYGMIFQRINNQDDSDYGVNKRLPIICFGGDSLSEIDWNSIQWGIDELGARRLRNFTGLEDLREWFVNLAGGREGIRWSKLLSSTQGTNFGRDREYEGYLRLPLELIPHTLSESGGRVSTDVFGHLRLVIRAEQRGVTSGVGTQTSFNFQVPANCWPVAAVVKDIGAWYGNGVTSIDVGVAGSTQLFVAGESTAGSAILKSFIAQSLFPLNAATDWQVTMSPAPTNTKADSVGFWIAVCYLQVVVGDF